MTGGSCHGYLGRMPERCTRPGCGLRQQDHPRIMGADGHLINTFGCPHSGAPCPACQSGQRRTQMFFKTENEDER